MDYVVTPLKTLMSFSVHLNVQLKFYNLPFENNPDVGMALVFFGGIDVNRDQVLILVIPGDQDAPLVANLG